MGQRAVQRCAEINNTTWHSGLVLYQTPQLTSCASSLLSIDERSHWLLWHALAFRHQPSTLSAVKTATSNFHRETLWPDINDKPPYQWPKQTRCTSKPWTAGDGELEKKEWGMCLCREIQTNTQRKREREREHWVCLTFLALVFCYMRRPRGSGIEEASPPPPCTHTSLATICLRHLCTDLPGPIKHAGGWRLVIEWLTERASKTEKQCKTGG